MNLGLAGETALVTGSSRGLGKATATVLAAEGANVMVNGRDEERLAAAADEIRERATGEVAATSADLTDPDDVERLVEETVSEFGGLDHLVTSVGGPPGRIFAETTDEEWEDTYETLVMSVVRLARAVAPHLEEGSGSIVNIASMTVKEASPTNVLSSSVRMAVIGLEKTLSKEFAPEIRANAILPGAHDTPRVRELGQDKIARGDYDSMEEIIEERAETIPVDRLGDAEELGNLAAFLCSDRAGFINGAAIPHDGGAHASNL